MSKTVSAAVLVNAKSALLVAASVILSGCSLAGNPSLEGYGPGLSKTDSVSLHSSGNGSYHTAYKEALEQSFRGRGFSIATDGRYVADFAISARASNSAIAVVKDTDQEVAYVSAARKRKFLQECDGERLRATLIVFDRSDSSVAFRGMRESDVCEVTETAVSVMADELVASAANR